MSNVPPNTKSFSLDDAIASHPLITRAGQPAKFIAYVPENEATNQVIVSVSKLTKNYYPDGKYVQFAEDGNDLFLAPIGYCEGKPVFAGDKLIGTEHNSVYKDKEFIANTGHSCFDMFKWPSKSPVTRQASQVVETKISSDELCIIYQNDNTQSLSGACRSVANKAIERAIADGDCIPTGCVLSLLNKAVNNVEEISTTKTLLVEKVLKDYLEGLK